jgi:bacteriorhodopsin
MEPTSPAAHLSAIKLRRWLMGRYVLLWLLGVPIPILALIWAFGGLH